MSLTVSKTSFYGQVSIKQDPSKRQRSFVTSPKPHFILGSHALLCSHHLVINDNQVVCLREHPHSGLGWCLLMDHVTFSSILQGPHLVSVSLLPGVRVPCFDPDEAPSQCGINGQRTFTEYLTTDRGLLPACRLVLTGAP